MGLFTRSFKKASNEKRVGEIPVITIDGIHRGMDHLVELVKQIRPVPYNNYKQADFKFKSLLYKLQNDKSALFSLRKALLTQFLNSNFIPALTESGMVGSRGFLQEFITKLKHKILPPLLEENNFLYVINHIFYDHHDHIWAHKIDRQLWVDFFKLLGVHVDVKDTVILKQLDISLQILCHRTVTLGLEKEVMNNLKRDDFTDYPFLILDNAVQDYLHVAEHFDGVDVSNAINKIVAAITKCKKTIEEISENRRLNGTSLSQTYILFRIEQHLDRLLLIAQVLDSDNEFDPEHFVEYFIRVIRYEKEKSSIRAFVSANLAFLAFKITEHGGTRGEKYITATRSEYWFMIKSAMGGGFFISFTALIKNLITKLTLPPFWQGFAYSVNYAAGFQVMHETHTTLATKQPAFTASAIAASLDYFKEFRKPDMYALAITIARTSRSQIASFFGNLIIVFPLSYSLAAFYHSITGQLLVNKEAAHHLLEEQHPYLSFSLMYACFTGFFLFLSGLIAGYVENGINYGKVNERVKNHPVFKNTLTSLKLQKVTSYITDNLGPLVGNIALGFFLGMSGFLGHIFGIPFDIRHITIAAGNSAIAFYTQSGAESTSFLLTVFGGVLLIGLLNFLVSFSLAFFLAIKSRGVRLQDYPEMLSVVGKFFVKFPTDFIFPPRHPREVDEVKRKFRMKK